MDKLYDRQLYLDSLVEFRKKLSETGFWESKVKREVALNALAEDFVRTDHGDRMEEDAASLVLAIMGYERRLVFLCTDEALNLVKDAISFVPGFDAVLESIKDEEDD